MSQQCSSCRAQIEHNRLVFKRWFISKVVEFKTRQFRALGFPMGGTVTVECWKLKPLPTFATAICPTCALTSPDLHDKYVIDEAWRNTPVDMRGERFLDVRRKPAFVNDKKTGFRSAKTHDLLFADREISELKFYPSSDDQYLIWATWKTDGSNQTETYDPGLLDKSIRNLGFKNVVEYLNAEPSSNQGSGTLYPEAGSCYCCEFPSPDVIFASAKAGSNRILDEVPNVPFPEAYQEAFATTFWKTDIYQKTILAACENAPPHFRAPLSKLLSRDSAHQPAYLKTRLMISSACIGLAATAFVVIGEIWFKPYIDHPNIFVGLLFLLSILLGPFCIFIAIMKFSQHLAVRRVRTQLKQWLTR